MLDIIGYTVFVIGLISSLYMAYIGNIVLYIISLELCNLGILYNIVENIYIGESDMSCLFLFIIIIGLSGINTAINISILIKVKISESRTY